MNLSTYFFFIFFRRDLKVEIVQDPASLEFRRGDVKPVTLSDQAKLEAAVPQTAKSFCQIFPSDVYPLGGFAYFSGEEGGTVIQVSKLCDSDQTTSINTSDADQKVPPCIQILPSVLRPLILYLSRKVRSICFGIGLEVTFNQKVLISFISERFSSVPLPPGTTLSFRSAIVPPSRLLDGVANARDPGEQHHCEQFSRR